MTDHPARIADVMTRLPVTIGSGESLAAARELMERYRIRHLPVMELGSLVGVVSARELDLLATAPEVDAVHEPVSRAMATDVLAVEPDESVGEVARKMVGRRAGSAVVCRRGDVVGIFTTVDALALLARAA
jgi:acetoin utilization protein AcuB